jgi:large subunit ribosomal protein L21
METIAVIKTGGKQYKVSEGVKLLIEKLPAVKKGDKLEFEDLLHQRKVLARILEPEVKGGKVTILKFKPKNRYRRKTGHRQQYTQIEIQKIG